MEEVDHGGHRAKAEEAGMQSYEEDGPCPEPPEPPLAEAERQMCLDKSQLHTEARGTVGHSANNCPRWVTVVLIATVAILTLIILGLIVVIVVPQNPDLFSLEDPSKSEIMVHKNCKDCIYGGIGCSFIRSKCWAKGICQGQQIKTTTTEDVESCQDLCHETTDCRWFTFESFSGKCFLHSTCDSIQKSSQGYISSGLDCPGKTGYTKVLVGGGFISPETQTSKFEILDLENPTSKCQPVPDYPMSVFGAITGLRFDEKPIICGGHDGRFMRIECYILNSTWQSLPQMSRNLYYTQLVPSPFANQSNHLVMVGGHTPTTDVKVLTLEQWEDSSMIPNLPKPIRSHCTLLINSTTLMTVGGFDWRTLLADTFYFRSTSPVPQWVPGPALNIARFQHACGRIRMQTQERHCLGVIAVGGFYTMHPYRTSSVEVLDLSSDTWRSGPELPFTWRAGKLVEDPLGGVILIGGESSRSEYSNALFRLPHAGQGARWIELPQKLSIGRYHLMVIPVPDDFANCTVV